MESTCRRSHWFCARGGELPSERCAAPLLDSNAETLRVSHLYPTSCPGMVGPRESLMSEVEVEEEEEQELDFDDDTPSSSMITDVHISEQGLDEIPERYLKDCTGLYELRRVHRFVVTRNNVVQLPPAISRFTNLTYMDVSNNALTELPEEIGALKKLKTLLVRNNLLDNLPKSLRYLSALETLNVSGNHLTEVPPVVFEIPKLKALYLGANQIESLPFHIGSLTNLVILYLGGNRLHEIPATIGRLRSLTSLSLCDNQLETLPPTIAELELLETLALHDNRIRTLPTEIVRLENLQQLSLRNNPLVHQFVQDIALEPPTLKELTGRLVRVKMQPDVWKMLPHELIHYLNSASQCVNPKCKGVYFDARVEHIKFVDFCGKYRVPLLQYLCSPRCTSHSPAVALSDHSDSEDDSQGSPSSIKMRKVLLG